MGGTKLGHTSSLSYDRKAFKGVRTHVQYALGLIPIILLEFNRSKVDHVWKLVNEVHAQLMHSNRTNQPEVST